MKLIQSQLIDKVQVFTIEGSVDELASKVSEYFTGKGYRLESGTTSEGVYGIGNDLLRILLGVFARRYKFNIHIRPNGDKVQLDISKAMTGASGGAIGYMKLNQEFEKVTQDITALVS